MYFSWQFISGQGLENPGPRLDRCCSLPKSIFECVLTNAKFLNSEYELFECSSPWKETEPETDFSVLFPSPACKLYGSLIDEFGAKRKFSEFIDIVLLHSSASLESVKLRMWGWRASEK